MSNLYNLGLWFLESHGVTARPFFQKVRRMHFFHNRDKNYRCLAPYTKWEHVLMLICWVDAGFRSRVRYINVLDPTNMCYYVSEILDAGRDGPLFMVIAIPVLA